MARPRKKETDEKALAKIVTDVLKDSPHISDIGTIIALLGSESAKDLEQLKESCASVDEFLDLARQRADIMLVTAAIKAAVGYEYAVTQEYKDGSSKQKKKYVPADTPLLKFILINRLPEYFSDTKKVEINRKNIDIKANTEEEIKKFAGKLMNIIEAEFEIDDNNS